MIRTGTTNPDLAELIKDLKRLSNKEKVKLWARIAKDLEKPSRMRRIVNISRINRHSKEGETIIVPGKVLGTGMIKHKVNIAAFSFSQSAMESIERAKGVPLYINDLMKQNPKGEKVRILG
jgi:large subunit ribosomal protein L18e